LLQNVRKKLAVAEKPDGAWCRHTTVETVQRSYPAANKW